VTPHDSWRLTRAVWSGTRLSSLLLAVTCVFLAGVPAPAKAARGGAEPAAQSVSQPPLYDLQGDEALGGHTLARHVGRTDEELAERLRREPNISAASTWSDVMVARRTVGLAVEQSRDRIAAWASRSGSRPNLTLNYVQHGGPPIGRSLVRGEPASRPCDRALVVLRWLERSHRWIVLTSYPETRR
jgi:hypothetical protein